LMWPPVVAGSEMLRVWDPGTTYERRAPENRRCRTQPDDGAQPRASTSCSSPSFWHNRRRPALTSPTAHAAHRALGLSTQGTGLVPALQARRSWPAARQRGQPYALPAPPFTLGFQLRRAHPSTTRGRSIMPFRSFDAQPRDLAHSSSSALFDFCQKTLAS